MKKKGLAIKEMYLPSQLKIEIKKLEDDKWLCHYEETIEDMPEEVIETSIKLVKEQFGVDVERKGNTFSYTLKGGRNAVFGVILGEALGMCDIGDLSLREVIVLAGLGGRQLQQFASKQKG
jgi:hypothetical protein